MRAAGKLKRPCSSVTTVVVMVEPSFLALTRTPSIAPSSLEDTNPVRAACARAPLDTNAAASRATAAPSERCHPRMGDLPMNRFRYPDYRAILSAVEAPTRPSAGDGERRIPWPTKK